MTSFNKQLNDLVKITLTETTKNQTDDNVNLQVMEELAKSQDFIQDNNPVGKRYTTNRIKSINFLSNITYVEINKEDFYNENFIFDVYLLVTKNLNPFSLDRKLTDKNKHEMIYMLCKKYMARNFYRHICKEQNFLYLNGKNALQPKVLGKIHDFLKESDNNYKDLRNNLLSYKNIFKYVYSNVFSEIYCSTECRGFDLKSDFHIIFKTYKDKKQLEIFLRKNPDNYETISNDTSIFEQKPIKVDDFNEIEEKQVKERVEKRKQKRREVAENNKLLKKQRKLEENKEKENGIQKRLNELKKESRKTKKFKKQSKKFSDTILKM